MHFDEGQVRPRWRLPDRFAFPFLAALLLGYFFASSAPSPLFVVFQGRWGFSPGLLTLAFGIYALVLLVVLLMAGSLSDHLGRRPVILLALVMQIATMILFLTARGIGGLIAARVAQGLAMGVVNGALSAAIVEAAPAHCKRLGALMTSIAPLAGLSLGSLMTGWAVSLSQWPEDWMFGTLAAVFLACCVLVLGVPESTSPRLGVWASLVPRMAVAVRARAVFVRGLPLLLVIWALCGLIMALGASLMGQVFGIHSGSVNGMTVGVLCGAAAIAPPLMRQLKPAMIALLGMAAVSVGVAVLLAAVQAGLAWLFFLGLAVGGAGLGASFSGLVQSVAPLADEHERAELFAAIYVVTYLSLSIPPIMAGFLIPRLGFLPTLQGYLAVMLAAGLAGTWGQWRGARLGC